MNWWVTICFIVGCFMGACAHERDMARNFEKTGNAGAWFHDISCEEARSK